MRRRRRDSTLTAPGRRWRALLPVVATAAGLLVAAPGAPGARAGAPVAAGAGLPLLGADVAADEAALVKLRSDGINTVSLFVWWVADSPDATSVHPFIGTEPDAALAATMQAAHDLGMRVVLTPTFTCTGCPGGWRGTMNLHAPDVFFASYRAFIDHYADLGQANGATTLLVGSELSTLEGQDAAWRAVIAEARRHFRGAIGYEENWDMLGRAAWLDAVDVIGVSAYFPLDDAPSPSLAQLLADWHHSAAAATRGRDWVSAVGALSARFHRPVLFGEVGYMAGQYAARAPYLDFYGLPDPQLQADLYQAVLETFGRYPWWAGAVWWDWESGDGAAANGRTFRGKPAEALLALWYGAGMRPADPGQPLLPGG